MAFSIKNLFGSLLYNVIKVIKTTDINGISTWIHSWSSESMDTTVFAEPVTRFVRAKLVQGKILFTFH
jgi:hypothetical protein